jgi:hypothetical protein
MGTGLADLDSLIAMGITEAPNNRGQVAVLNYQKPGSHNYYNNLRGPDPEGVTEMASTTQCS